MLFFFIRSGVEILHKWLSDFFNLILNFVHYWSPRVDKRMRACNRSVRYVSR